MNYSPIILFAYNRLWHVKETVESLKRNYLAKDSELFVYSDGFKDSNDEVKVDQVRQYIGSIGGFNKVNITHRKSHMGLADSIIEGVSQIIAKYGKAIILEDDLVSAPIFLKFMNSALNMYKNNQHIFSVTGYSYPVQISHHYKYPVYLYYRCSSWGWGTWKNRWNKVDWDIKDFSTFKKNDQAKLSFNRGGEDLSDMLDFQMRGKIDSWAIRWCYAHYKHSSYCLYPVVSQIKNIGLDGSGTHRSFRRIDQKLDESKTNINLPKNISNDDEINKALSEYFKKDIIRKIVFHIKKIYPLKNN